MYAVPMLLLVMLGSGISCREAAERPLDSAPCLGVWLHPDADGDGWGDTRLGLPPCEAPEGWIPDDQDCDDQDFYTNPKTVWWIDADGDRYGAPPTLQRCAAPYGYVREPGDCDDGDPEVSPLGAETCNGYDDDCDGLSDDADTDDDVVGELAWYWDIDGDGYGRISDVFEACVQPEGYAALPTDCDDNDAAVHPGAEEGDCTDPVDYNCDGAVGWRDTDQDGFVACRECDDGDDGRYPGAPETCNSVDDDCDGAADEPEDLTGALDWYRDADGDRYGDPAVVVYGCLLPEGYASNDLDCDDTDAGRAPNAAEVCDDRDTDEDCDGLAEDADPDSTGQPDWYTDADGDGSGDDSTQIQLCDPPAGLSGSGGDCDDGAAGVSPAAAEVCNGIDDDCDGETDEDSAIDAQTFYADGDGDGWGSVLRTALACSAPPGFSALSGDCDDGDAAVNPAAPEVCDGVDDDCDRSVDEPDAADAPLWYADNDGDGSGWEGGPVAACQAPAGYLAVGGDCDDADRTVHPGAAEVCDGQDNDCDGSGDGADAAGAAAWYADSDGDGYGDPAVSAVQCDPPSGYTADATDCDDADAAVNPGMTEICDGAGPGGSDTDEDCDGLAGDADPGVFYTAADRRWPDLDGDGWGDPAGALDACAPPAGYVSVAGDCADTDPVIHSGMAEVCDALDADEDCDGLADDGDPDADLSAATEVCPDRDGDGWGDAALATVRCDLPSGWSAVCEDCDDRHASARPGGTEICDPRDLDEDCDGLRGDADPSVQYGAGDVLYPDLDGDGWGGSPGVIACAGSGVRTGGDCDDSSDLILPGAREQCGDSVDDDCDGADLACDALPTGSAHIRLSGGAGLGAVLVSGADLDGDGYTDLLAGMPDGAGLVQGFGLTAVPWDILPQGSADQLGADIAILADSDGAGTPLVLLGAPLADAGVRAGGVVWLVSGAGGGTLSSLDLRIGAEQPGDLAGSAVSGGDIDGDGLPDPAVGAPGSSGGAGGVWVFRQPGGYTPLYAADLILTGLPGSGAGQTAALTDTDGDGVDEVLIGAPALGAVYRADGQIGLLSLALADAAVSGSPGFGATLEAGGDFDGDGRGDVLIGDPSTPRAGRTPGACGSSGGSISRAPSPPPTPGSASPGTQRWRPAPQAAGCPIWTATGTMRSLSGRRGPGAGSAGCCSSTAGAGAGSGRIMHGCTSPGRGRS